MLVRRRRLGREGVGGVISVGDVLWVLHCRRLEVSEDGFKNFGCMIGSLGAGTVNLGRMSDNPSSREYVLEDMLVLWAMHSLCELSAYFCMTGATLIRYSFS